MRANHLLQGPRATGIIPLLTTGLLVLPAPAVVRADGSLPPLPYRYLHPPPALASVNKPPTIGMRLIPADYLRALTSWFVFTPDGRAGLSGRKGALQPSSSATALLIAVAAVLAYVVSRPDRESRRKGARR